jgi:hypothetical protein
MNIAETRAPFLAARTIAAACAALAVAASVVAQPPPCNYSPMGVANGCFVESVACLDAFHEAIGGDGWGRVLLWGAREEEVMVAGHAVAVLVAADALWCWDVNHGWMRLPVPEARRGDAAAVAAPVVANYPRVTALYPMLWDDGGQAPEAPPPGAEPAGEASGRQDAQQAAARLSRHRPVNLIEIIRLKDGETRTSEAIVFIFGGRMCVYSPETGTITFHVRSSVWNVRLTLEMVRSIFPGVQRVRTLALPESGR